MFLFFFTFLHSCLLFLTFLYMALGDVPAHAFGSQTWQNTIELRFQIHSGNAHLSLYLWALEDRATTERPPADHMSTAAPGRAYTTSQPTQDCVKKPGFQRFLSFSSPNPDVKTPFSGVLTLRFLLAHNMQAFVIRSFKVKLLLTTFILFMRMEREHLPRLLRAHGLYCADFGTCTQLLDLDSGMLRQCIVQSNRA